MNKYFSPFWILTYYRCGSVNLCSLLNSTKLFGKLNNSENGYLIEHYGEPRIYRDIPENIFNQWKTASFKERNKIFKSHFKLYHIGKIIRSQFIENCGLQDNDKKYIESNIKGLKYIHLIRSNIFDRVISIFFAKKTNTWFINHMNNKEELIFFKKQIKFNEKEIIEIFNKEYEYYKKDWKLYLKDSNYLEINFNDLIQDPSTILIKTLRFIGQEIDGNIIKKIIKNYYYRPTKRPETEEYKNKLKNIVSQKYGIFT